MAKKKNNEDLIPLFQGLDFEKIQVVHTIKEEQAEKYVFETVSFDAIDRETSCLEVDFPILNINEVATVEAEPPCTKPIYKMSKWWARRRSSIFRQLAIASLTKSPNDISKVAQASWAQMYRKSHQKHGKFKNFKILDPFMGGGTSVIEASRLGADVIGVDINPIAWWVVTNQTTFVEPDKIDSFFEYILRESRYQIEPFFVADSPRGFTGKWTPSDKNPLDLSLAERKRVKWKGPEVVYTFWMRHAMCTDPDCFHVTPAVGTAKVAHKSVSIKYLDNCVCNSCGGVFDLEYGQFRMAPSAELKLSNKEEKFAYIINDSSQCPHCTNTLDSNWIKNQESKKEKQKSKKVTHTLFLNPDWLKGITSKSKEYFGGFPGASNEQNERWFKERIKGLSLVEFRGEPDTGFDRSNLGSANGSFVCAKCGRQDEISKSSKISGHMASFYPYLIQGIDHVAKAKKYPYSGRFFDIPSIKEIITSFAELDTRTDLHGYIPNEDLWYGHQTHQRDNLPGHGFKKWSDFFNKRQLYVNSLILKVIAEAPIEVADNKLKSLVLGAYQNFLRHNCNLTIWHLRADQISPLFSNNNYHPKATYVEINPFTDLGVGNLVSFIKAAKAGMENIINPYDLRLANESEKGKTFKVISEDVLNSDKINLYCRSSTDLKNIIDSETIDLVLTDPPFGDNIQYAELSDFFMVWLHKPLQKIYPHVFNSAQAPKTLEAVANKARHPGKELDGSKKADAMYDRLLTLCWKEAYRVLKPGGLLVFTFHHDKDEAWINVLTSLFNAGLSVVATYPIRSDKTKGDGEFGSKKIEYDIVHVCRKRTTETKEIYWATLRKQILQSVKEKAFLLAQHRSSGLHLADLEVIIRGEVLEQYSKYYGKVKKNLAGDTISIREILIEANAVSLSVLQIQDSDKLPDGIDADTRIFFSLFREGPQIEFGAAKKRLKGTGSSLEELVSLGWVEIKKIENERFAVTKTVSERWIALSRKRHINLDLDQAYFSINCCLGDRQLNGKAADLEEWIEENYKTFVPTVIPILKYMESNHFGADYKQAIGVAYRTLERTLNKIKESDGEFKKVSDQLTLF